MASINMKLSLEPDIEERPRPLQYHESNQTKLIEEENVLQKELDKFQFFAAQNKLVINTQKIM